MSKLPEVEARRDAMADAETLRVNGALGAAPLWERAAWFEWFCGRRDAASYVFQRSASAAFRAMPALRETEVK